MTKSNIDKFQEREELIQLFEQHQPVLTQTQKQAFHLRYIEDLSWAEIAELVATTRSAAYDAVKKAEKKLLKFKILNDIN